MDDGVVRGAASRPAVDQAREQALQQRHLRQQRLAAQPAQPRLPPALLLLLRAARRRPSHLAEPGAAGAGLLCLLLLLCGRTPRPARPAAQAGLLSFLAVLTSTPCTRGHMALIASVLHPSGEARPAARLRSSVGCLPQPRACGLATAGLVLLRVQPCAQRYLAARGQPAVRADGRSSLQRAGAWHDVSNRASAEHTVQIAPRARAERAEVGQGSHTKRPWIHGRGRYGMRTKYRSHVWVRHAARCARACSGSCGAPPPMPACV